MVSSVDPSSTVTLSSTCDRLPKTARGDAAVPESEVAPDGGVAWDGGGAVSVVTAAAPWTAALVSTAGPRGLPASTSASCSPAHTTSVPTGWPAAT